MMYYLMIAGGLYAWTAVTLMRAEPPETYRDVVGAVLGCALVGVAWPLVLVWRGLTGMQPHA